MMNEKINLGYSAMDNANEEARRNTYGYHYEAVETPVHTAAHDETETQAEKARRELYHRAY